MAKGILYFRTFSAFFSALALIWLSHAARAADESCESALSSQIGLVARGVQSGIISVEAIEDWIAGKPLKLNKIPYDSANLILAKGIQQLFDRLASPDREPFAREFRVWQQLQAQNQETQIQAEIRTEPLLSPKLLQAIPIEKDSKASLATARDSSGQSWLAVGIPQNSGDARIELYRLGEKDPVKTFNLAKPRGNSFIRNIQVQLRLNTKGDLDLFVLDNFKDVLRATSQSKKLTKIKTGFIVGASSLKEWQKMGDQEVLTGNAFIAGARGPAVVKLGSGEELVSIMGEKGYFWEGRDGFPWCLYKKIDETKWTVHRFGRRSQEIRTMKFPRMIGQDGKTFVFFDPDEKMVIWWDGNTNSQDQRSVLVPNFDMDWRFRPLFFNDPSGQRWALLTGSNSLSLLNMVTGDFETKNFSSERHLPLDSSWISFAFARHDRRYLAALEGGPDKNSLERTLILYDLETATPLSKLNFNMPAHWKFDTYLWTWHQDEQNFYFIATLDDRVEVYRLFSK